jgi:hypothetical protein
MKFVKHASLVAAIISISACGGGGSPAPATVNSANTNTTKPADTVAATPSGGTTAATPPAATPPAATPPAATPPAATPPAATPPAATPPAATPPAATPPAATPPAAAGGIPASLEIQSVVVSGAQIKAFSSSGVIADSTATAPTTWSAASAPIKTDLTSTRAVRLLNGKYVLLSQFAGSGAARILYSFDGSSWSEASLPAIGPTTPNILWDVTWGTNGRYVAVASSDATANQAAMLESTDAINWRPVTQASLQGHLWTGVAFGNGTFVASSQEGDTATSTDGLNWTVRKTSQAIVNGTNTFYPGLQKIAYSTALNSFVVGSNARNENSVFVGAAYTSPDGVNWTRRNTNYPANVIRIECAGTQCVAATSGAAPALLVTSDFVTWTRAYTETATGSPYVLGLGKTSAGWVAAGVGGLLLTSTDGSVWTKTAAR